jgi:hypothetical protein
VLFKNVSYFLSLTQKYLNFWPCKNSCFAGVWHDRLWPDEWTAVTADGKRSAQFEHTSGELKEISTLVIVVLLYLLIV